MKDKILVSEENGEFYLKLKKLIDSIRMDDDISKEHFFEIAEMVWHIKEYENIKVFGHPES